MFRPVRPEQPEAQARTGNSIMGIVLFTSLRPYERAENIKSVYNAYDGEKEFVQRKRWQPLPDFSSGKYSLLVADELPSESPGKCIFIGHGMGAGKTYGLDMPDPYFSRPDLITYAIASSEDMVQVVSRQCGIPKSKVVPLGMPRTDAYFNAAPPKEDGKYRYHLYAPTFRSGYWYPNWNEVHWHMPEGHKLMVKAHMVTGPIIRRNVWSSIEEFSPHIPSTPFLFKADTVVTDYSSIMFDAMVLRKPVILFARDKDRYLYERKMYFSYPDTYSKYFFDKEKGMAECLGYAEWDDSFEKLRQFYAGACDGHSVERTLDLIRSVI